MCLYLDPRLYGMSRILHWQIITDASGQPFVQARDCMDVEDGADKLSRNVGDYKPTLRNITEELKSYLRSKGSLKSYTCVVNVLQVA